MRSINKHKTRNAKATLAFAVCIILAATAQAEDDKKSSTGGAGQSTSAQSGGTSSLSSEDQKFVKQAAEGGQKEVAMGALGTQKASSEAVKQYAKRLLEDHKKANAELKQIASSKGITLPDDRVASSHTDSEQTKVRGGSEDHKGHEAHVSKLQSLSGTEFDREFVRMAVKDHEKDVKEFEKAAQNAQDPEIKMFAQKTAPKLREHLQQAKALQAQVGGTDSSNVGAPGSSSGSTSAGTGSRQTSGSSESSEGQNSSGQGSSDVLNKSRGNTGGETPAGSPSSK